MISDTVNFEFYVGNGATTIFNFAHRFLANSDIKVYLDNVLQGSGYTISGAGTANGGTVTFTVAPATGVEVFIFDDPPVKQETDFVNNITTMEKNLDDALDRAILAIQAIEYKLSKAIRGNVFDQTVNILNFGGNPNTFVVVDQNGVPALLTGSSSMLQNFFDSAALSVTAQDAADLVIAQQLLRETLVANRTYFVRTDGNDNNTGLADSAGGAFLTIQKAINTVINRIDLNGFNVTIQVRDGTFTAGATADRPYVGRGSVTLQGNTSTPANCIISTTSADCLFANNGGRLDVLGFKLQTTTSGSCASATRFGKIVFSGAMEFGSCAGSHLIANGGSIDLVSNYSIVGNAINHFEARELGRINAAGLTITLTGTPAFSGSFVLGADNGAIIATGITFSGAATGARFILTGGGYAKTNNSSLTYFPGNAAGTISFGGVYDTISAYSGAQGFIQATLTDAANIDWNLDTQQVATVTLGGNRTMNAPTNGRAGFTYIVRVVQDGTGSRTLSWANAIFKFPGGTEPVLSTAAGAIDVLSFYFDGTSLLGSIQKAFS